MQCRKEGVEKLVAFMKSSRRRMQMHKYHCLNPIAAVGLDLFSDDYQKVEDLKDAEAVLWRSAAMHDLELPGGTCGSGESRCRRESTFLWINARRRELSYSTPRAPMQTVSRSWCLRECSTRPVISWAASTASGESERREYCQNC